MAQTRKPTVRDALIALLQEFGMKKDDSGACQGFAYAALIAALSPKVNPQSRYIGDMETFVNRLKFILAIYRNKDNVEKVNEVREKVKRGESLDDTEKLYLELPAFLERVHLFFNPVEYAEKYKDLFPQRKQLYHQDSEKVFSLLAPDFESTITRDAFFVSEYDKEKLKIYCRLLKHTIETIMSSHPEDVLGITLKITDHTITLAYQNNTWIIFDHWYTEEDFDQSNNKEPKSRVVSADDMAEKMIECFSRGEIKNLYSFSSEIYTVNPALKEQVIAGMRQLQESAEWKAIQIKEPTNSFLTIASKIGDVTMLKELMKSQRYDQLSSREINIFCFTALLRGHENFVLELLEKPGKIDFSARIRGTGKTLFDLAEERNLLHVMAKIIECNIDVNMKDNAPKSYYLIQNTLKAVREYLKNKKQDEVNLEREPKLIKIIKNMYRLSDSRNDSNYEKYRSDVLTIIDDIEKEHGKKYKEAFSYTPSLFYKNIWQSSLAKGLKVALKNTEAEALQHSQQKKL